jgi:acetyltransferase-like isoleucine patch superfamily enzyme
MSVREALDGMRGAANRMIQFFALYAPGAQSFRVRLHRLRGVHIGEDVFIGTDCMIETSKPHLVWIGSHVGLGARVTIVAHFRGATIADTTGDPNRVTVRIEDDAFIGPGVIILPNVTIGHGAVVTAGSVVTRSIPPLTMVQGNPAKPIARCGVPLSRRISAKKFYAQLRPIRPEEPRS